MKKTNIILITIDSLRKDFAGAIENFFDRSIIFENAISQSTYTTSSFASIFTSKYPSRLKSIKYVENVEGVSVKDDITLPEILKENGYRTAGIHSNPLLSKLFGFEKGFDYFYDSLPQKSFIPQLAKVRLNKLLRLFRTQAYQSAEVINKKAIKWISNKDKSPFFMWLHYMDCHGPYISKKGFKVKNKIKAEKLWRKATKSPEKITRKEIGILKSTYSEEINYVTNCLTQLFDQLRKLEKFDDTLVIITADHGEEFKEHGGFTHQHKLYDELLKVPLIIKFPKDMEIEGNIEEQVGLINLTPTILDFMGIDLLKYDFEGNSLEPLLENVENDNLPEHIFSEADIVPKYNGCIRTKNWKFIKNNVGAKEELYNLENDPREQNNLIKEKLDVANELREKLNIHTKQSSKYKDSSDKSEEVSSEVKERLRTLGYID